MRSLKGFLREEKNTHMEHAEDLIFNEGVNGARKAINFLRDLRDMLAGNSKTKVTATVKWDGAPAIFCGIDPRDGKFFVAKKGVFNKEPKVYKTASDIEADTTGELAAKLKVALTELSKLGIKSGVYQGDLMFTNDLRKETIDGQKYITFHPNTIVYAIPTDSELAKQIEKAKIGVVWHTTYTGQSFESMTASFGKSIVQHMKQVPSVWMDDANYKDYSGTATFTAAETKEVTNILSNAGKLFASVKAETLNGISEDEDLLLAVKTFGNAKIRKGETIDNPTQHVKDLFNWIYDRYQKEIDTKKTEKGKSAQEEKRKKILAFFAKHPQNEIAKIFELANLIANAKHKIIDKMNQAGHISTFIKTTNGFKTTGVEGFVAIDHLSGGAVKIVNRMEFSKSNFDPEIIKGWQR
jgi:predicted transcriptional regulator